MTMTIYRERAYLVAFLSKLYESHLAKDEQEPEWPVVCIHSPMGQLAWHISQEDMDLFKHLEYKPNDWDSHTTEEKYERLSSFK